MEKTIDFLKKVQTFYLGTVDGDMPRIRPFGAVTEYERRLYFSTSNTKDVFKQVMKNPNVCVVACCGRSWIRIQGIAKRDTRTAVKQRMLDDNPVLTNSKRFNGVDDPKFEVFGIDNMKVESY